MKSSIFWDIMSCKISRRLGGVRRLCLQCRRTNEARNQPEYDSKVPLPNCFMLLSCLAYYLALNMEATYSSETSVNFQWTTRRSLLKDGNLHSPRCENRKSYDITFLCDCEAIANLRFRHLGQFFMEPSDYYDAPINRVGLIKG
jgi:hypothetical protein